MGPYHDFAILMIIMGLLLALAIAFLVLRDRRTLRAEMSADERRRAIARNSAQTAHWWYVAGLAAMINALVLDFTHISHQSVSFRIGEIGVTLFIVFRYYRARSKQSIEDHSTTSESPMH